MLNNKAFPVNFDWKFAGLFRNPEVAARHQIGHMW
jgi:hypothetical protein